MTLLWIEEGRLLTQEEFDRLTRIVRPWKRSSASSQRPSMKGHLYQKIFRKESACLTTGNTAARG